MNRLDRRREAKQLPANLRAPVLRGRVPVVEVTPEQLARYNMGPAVRNGTILVIPGHRLNATRNGLEQCPKGQETALRIAIVPGGGNVVDKT